MVMSVGLRQALARTSDRVDSGGRAGIDAKGHFQNLASLRIEVACSRDHRRDTPYAPSCAAIAPIWPAASRGSRSRRVTRRSDVRQRARVRLLLLVQAGLAYARRGETVTIRASRPVLGTRRAADYSMKQTRLPPRFRKARPRRQMARVKIADRCSIEAHASKVAAIHGRLEVAVGADRYDPARAQTPHSPWNWRRGLSTACVRQVRSSQCLERPHIASACAVPFAASQPAHQSSPDCGPQTFRRPASLSHAQ